MHLVDAQKMREEHPENPEMLNVPNKLSLETLRIGNKVKLYVEPNQFWVRILELATPVDKHLIIGFIDDDLVATNECCLKTGDNVVFERRHIFQIVKK